MIRLLPHKEETLVVAHEWDTVLERLAIELQKPVQPGLPSSLSGWIKEDQFGVTLKVQRFNAFMPLVSGRIEPTSKGCILFLRYSLLPANRFFLSFWTFFLILAGILLILFDDEMLGNACILMVFLIHAIAWANFKLHLKVTRTILLKCLE